MPTLFDDWMIDQLQNMLEDDREYYERMKASILASMPGSMFCSDRCEENHKKGMSSYGPCPIVRQGIKGLDNCVHCGYTISQSRLIGPLMGDGKFFTESDFT